MDHRGQGVLVTGASSGIGAAFARALAERGANVLLVARSLPKLEALATELRERYGVRAEALPADLREAGAGARLLAEAARRKFSVDLLINNAGLGSYGPFETVSDERVAEQIAVNVASLVELTHAFLPAMIARGTGGIINVASTAAFQPVPYMAVYAATKAFVLSFSEALWAENRARGVRVLALCPGATETGFFDAVGTQEASVGKREPASVVVARALRALDGRRSYLVSGRANFWTAQLARLLPRAKLASLTARIMRPRQLKAA